MFIILQYTLCSLYLVLHSHTMYFTHHRHALTRDETIWVNAILHIVYKCTLYWQYCTILQYHTVANFQGQLILLLSWIILLAQKLNPSNLIVVHNAMMVTVVDPWNLINENNY